jgi:hypothetical protein
MTLWSHAADEAIYTSDAQSACLAQLGLRRAALFYGLETSAGRLAAETAVTLSPPCTFVIFVIGGNLCHPAACTPNVERRSVEHKTPHVKSWEWKYEKITVWKSNLGFSLKLSALILPWNWYVVNKECKRVKQGTYCLVGRRELCNCAFRRAQIFRSALALTRRIGR